jgi:carbon starvation protein
MSLLPIALGCAVVLIVAYRVYGSVLARLFQLDPNAATPAEELRDDVDYVPIESKFLLGQHFSAIAAAGPIVGPILAGVMFGWLPALLWILVGSIFIGGVHDMSALVASIRHKARSIAEVVRDHMSRRSYVLFLAFIWIALIYIIVAFTDVTAASFYGSVELENGQKVLGAGIASSSLLYLALPIIMGLLLRFTKLSLGVATVIFIPLVGVAIWVGQFIPLDLGALLGISNPQAHKVWNVLLLAYSFIAAVIPMWLWRQPRGHLGGYFLYIALGGALIGILFGGKSVAIEYPAFTGWTSEKGAALFPMLFITIACGACSGFHSIIASGTTSKQLKRETDARPIGYGAMLLEAMVAFISLSCVMMLASNSPVLQNPKPNFIYALGLGRFFDVLGVPATFAISFGLMAFTTFVYDTLDVCTRLGRYILQELLGWQDAKGRWVATSLTAIVPLFFLLQSQTDPTTGKLVEVWRTFWALFGASNQLLAALTLLGVTVWLVRGKGAQWAWVVTGIPTVFMYVMSVWALVTMIVPEFITGNGFKATGSTVAWVGVVLLALAFLMLLEAVRVLASPTKKPPITPQPIPVGT